MRLRCTLDARLALDSIFNTSRELCAELVPGTATSTRVTRQQLRLRIMPLLIEGTFCAGGRGGERNVNCKNIRERQTKKFSKSIFFSSTTKKV